MTMTFNPLYLKVSVVTFIIGVAIFCLSFGSVSWATGTGRFGGKDGGTTWGLWKFCVSPEEDPEYVKNVEWCASEWNMVNNDEDGYPRG